MFFYMAWKLLTNHQKQQLNYYCLDFTRGLHVISFGVFWPLYTCCISTHLIYICFPAFHSFSVRTSATRLGAILDVYLVFTYNIVFRWICLCIWRPWKPWTMMGRVPDFLFSVLYILRSTYGIMVGMVMMLKWPYTKYRVFTRKYTCS